MQSKNKVKTLIVVATCNGPDVMLDQLDAIKWSCQDSYEVVVVDDVGGLSLPCTVLRSNGKIKKPGTVGFKVNEGIKWALDHIDFEMVMVLDDDALPIGKGLDTWALDIFKKNPNAGLIGTMDDVKACAMYSEPARVNRMLEQLKQWILVDNWIPPKEVVFYAVNFQSRACVEKLNSMGMLNPDKEIWPSPCETFQSWVTLLAGFELYFWGRYPDQLKPPLYSMHHGSISPPDPRTIVSEFLVHHSIRRIQGVDEWTIRKHYQNMRQPLLF